MSQLTARPTRLLCVAGAALLAAGALGACTSPYGERGPGLPQSPSPSLSASQDGGPSGDTRPTDSPNANGEDTVALGEVVRDLPPGVDGGGALDSVAGVGWSSDGEFLYVTTMGSSSCPTVVTGLSAEAGTITVELETTGGAVCTMDYVPTTTLVPTPPDIPTTITQTAVLGKIGSAELAPAADPVVFSWIPAGEG